MPIDWKLVFTGTEPGRTQQVETPRWKDAYTLEAPPRLPSLGHLKRFLDLTHIKHCLVRPYCEIADYPLVETRELLPSFEADLWEHEKLPGFSLVAFARPIQYFHEVFQFERLLPVPASMRADHALDTMTRNLAVVQSRIARNQHERLRTLFNKTDITNLAHYPTMLPFLTSMDRAQVLGMHGPHPQDMNFYLAGVYASLPSDLDTEIKRYGQRIGKFSFDDPDSYERNRSFVYQRLMELYGFPMASERRTSAALFARRLHKMGEKFLIRTLGQSDRTLTTIWNEGGVRPYPLVEKITLVSLDEDHELLAHIYDNGYLVDAKKRVAILRVLYRQHKFSPDNVRQERAISIESQEIIHPITGMTIPDVNIIRDTSNMALRLNDIIRGEHSGRVIYKRSEIVENTDTDEKRLKFLYAWLSKHQRRIIGYSDEFYSALAKILDAYLFNPESEEVFLDLQDLHLEVATRYRYIQQARKVRMLEDLHGRMYKGERIPYSKMLTESVALLRELKFEIVSYFPGLVTTAIIIGESMLNNRYMLRTYIEKQEDALSPTGIEIKKNYGRLVTLIDELRAIQKSRKDTSTKGLV